MIDATVCGWVVADPSIEHDQVRFKGRAHTRYGPAVVLVRAVDPEVCQVLREAGRGDRFHLSGAVATRLWRDSRRVTHPAIEVLATGAVLSKPE